MKVFKLLFLSFILILPTLEAHTFSKVTTEKPHLVQKGEKKHWCPVCGMEIKKFYKTSHIAKLPNGTDRQYCSMRCLSVDMQEYQIDTKTIKVLDIDSNSYIDANSAFYVYGSKVKGTMSKKSKLGFKTKEGAEKFQNRYKGKLLSFDDALKNANTSLASDIVMVNAKKEKKMYPMGKLIYEKACQKEIDPNNYNEINELKSAVENGKFCKKLKPKQLQALSLYLFEVKRYEDTQKDQDGIVVGKDEKCPVCGMFVYKYPRWATQIFYGQKHYSFDGVKDMMKYYFDNKDGISKILVLDYYSQKTIDARKAFYVIGSDVYGPMGNELIAFKNKSEAKTFYFDHKGTQILEFKEITKDSVYRLDE